ncbi:hypothetical protein HDU96_003731, partial [Phlyctochytrium bullatum]
MSSFMTLRTGKVKTQSSLPVPAKRSRKKKGAEPLTELETTADPVQDVPNPSDLTDQADPTHDVAGIGAESSRSTDLTVPGPPSHLEGPHGTLGEVADSVHEAPVAVESTGGNTDLAQLEPAPAEAQQILDSEIFGQTCPDDITVEPADLQWLQDIDNSRVFSAYSALYALVHRDEAPEATQRGPDGPPEAEVLSETAAVTSDESKQHHLTEPLCDLNQDVDAESVPNKAPATPRTPTITLRTPLRRLDTDGHDDTPFMTPDEPVDIDGDAFFAARPTSPQTPHSIRQPTLEVPALTPYQVSSGHDLIETVPPKIGSETVTATSVRPVQVRRLARPASRHLVNSNMPSNNTTGQSSGAAAGLQNTASTSSAAVSTALAAVTTTTTAAPRAASATTSSQASTSTAPLGGQQTGVTLSAQDVAERTRAREKVAKHAKALSITRTDAESIHRLIRGLEDLMNSNTASVTGDANSPFTDPDDFARYVISDLLFRERAAHVYEADRKAFRVFETAIRRLRTFTLKGSTEAEQEDEFNQFTWTPRKWHPAKASTKLLTLKNRSAPNASFKDVKRRFVVGCKDKKLSRRMQKHMFTPKGSSKSVKWSDANVTLDDLVDFATTE